MAGLFDALRARIGAKPGGGSYLKNINLSQVRDAKARLPRDEAMQAAIGGYFDVVGPKEAALLRHYGLGPDDYLIDVGCGSGRLAKPLSADHKGPYLGIDLVPDLIAYARDIAARPDWRFEVIDHIGIPEAEGRADMVCFFSVLTHLLHEQSYWYLEEARRVLRPGGLVVFSFLEFRDPNHWPVFKAALEAAKHPPAPSVNVFIDREAIAAWASHLDLEMVEIRSGFDHIVADGEFGQALCVLRKPS